MSLRKGFINECERMSSKAVMFSFIATIVCFAIGLFGVQSPEVGISWLALSGVFFVACFVVAILKRLKWGVRSLWDPIEADKQAHLAALREFDLEKSRR